jgi:hypothetical protein
MTDIASSPAFRALSKVARRALHLIEQQTRDGSMSARLPRDQFPMCQKSATVAKRELVACGFVTTSVGRRQALIFERCNAWRDLDAVEASRRVAEVRGKRQADAGVL